jgi:hypothetical protein
MLRPDWAYDGRLYKEIVCLVGTAPNMPGHWLRPKRHDRARGTAHNVPGIDVYATVID